MRKYEYKTLSNDKSLGSMEVTSEALIYELCDSNVQAEQVILLVFDEARMLTTLCCDGEPPDSSMSQLSRFRLLRRSLRLMGQSNIRIFSILTDTSSRLTNFQPKNDEPSSRVEIVISGYLKLGECWSESCSQLGLWTNVNEQEAIAEFTILQKRHTAPISV